jgi:hypothetical protein
MSAIRIALQQNNVRIAKICSILANDGNNMQYWTVFVDSKHGIIRINIIWIYPVFRSFPITKDDRILRIFAGFNHYLSEDETWELSESIKPRSRRIRWKWMIKMEMYIVIGRVWCCYWALQFNYSVYILSIRYYICSVSYLCATNGSVRCSEI